MEDRELQYSFESLHQKIMSGGHYSMESGPGPDLV